MNNRIMAMLCALVAAMFISIVPVKADALVFSTDTAHKHAPVEHKATEATCMQEGNIAYYSCTGCEKISLNKEFTEITTPEKVKLAKNDDHKLTKLGVDKEATCYAKGSVSYYKCGVCGNCYTDESAKQILNDSVLPMKEHVWEWTYNDVSHWQKCSAQGCTQQTKGTAAHDKQCLDNKDGTHTWTCKVEGCEWSVKAEAHIDANKNCSCDFCDAEMHDLVHVDAKAPTCEVSGNVEYWFCNNANGCKKSFADETAQTVLTDSVVKATDHDFDPVKWGEGNQNQHWTLCNNEGCKQMGSIGNHSWKTIDNGDGKHGWGCEDCGYISKDIANHVFENKDGKCVCKDCGFTQNHQYGDYLIRQNAQGGSDYHYQVCKVCNATTEFEAHVYKTVKSTDGVVHGLTCETCGRATTQNCTDKDNDCICDKEGCGTPLKHDTKDMQYREASATCTETGWAKHYECLKCGNRFDLTGKPTTVEAVKTPALGHKLGGNAWTWKENADGTAHYKFCANNCGAHIYGTAEAAVEGEEAHTHGSFNVGKDAHESICAVCELTFAYEEHDHTKVEQTDVLSGVAKKQQHGLKCECGDVKYEVCTFGDDCICTVCGAARIHSADHVQFYDKKDPTCTETGKEYHAICKTCNAYFLTGTGKLVPATEKDIVIDALDHNWEEGTEIDSATGNHIESCERAGCKAVRSLAHDDKNGDCKCDINNCGRLIHSHQMVFNNPVAPTCKSAGSEAYYTYLECDKAMFAAVKTGNGYVEGEKISAVPTVAPLGCDEGGKWIPAENGKHEKYCTRCNAVVNSGEHDFSEGIICDDCGAHESLKHKKAKPASCTVGGNKEYWYSEISGKVFLDKYGRRETSLEKVTLKALDHDYTGWLNNGDKHKDSCQRPGCNWSKEEDHIAGENCRCKVCGSEVKGHEMKFFAMVPATCATAGHEAYYKCEGCNKLYDMSYAAIEEPAVIEAHKLISHDEKPATCTENGREAYLECRQCRKLYDMDRNVIEAPVVIPCHKLTRYKGMAATCTEEGYEAFYFCEICDQMYDLQKNAVERPVPIKALGHNYDNAKVQKDTRENKHFVACAHCGKKVYQEHGMVLSDPNKGNYHQWLCECGELKIEKHYDKNGDKICDACGHGTNAQSGTKVEQHDNITVQTGQKETINNNQTWLQNWMQSLVPSNSGGSTVTQEVVEESNTVENNVVVENKPAAENKPAVENKPVVENKPAAENKPTTAPSENVITPSAPSAAQTNVIVQFINWFLGLFGF